MPGEVSVFQPSSMEFRKLIVGYVVEVWGIEYSDIYEGSVFAGRWGRSVWMGKIDFGSVASKEKPARHDAALGRRPDVAADVPFG